MTDKAASVLSRRIVEAMEPEPHYLPNVLSEAPYHSRYAWWVYAKVDTELARDHYQRTGGPLIDVGWQPRSHRDPEICLRLINWILEGGCNVDFESGRVYFRADGKTPLRRWVSLSADCLEDFVAKAVGKLLADGLERQYV